MAASPTAYLFYGVILDDATAADLSEDDEYAAVETALQELGIDLIHFGETPEIHLALAIDRSVITAGAGTAERVRSLKVGGDWQQRLERACEIVETPVGEPAWYVTSRVSW